MDLVVRGLSRSPAFIVRIYDVRQVDSNGDPIATIHDVVLGTAGGGLVGPRDFSGDVLSVEIQETAGDFAGAGVAAGSATVVVEDPSGRFDPAGLAASPNGDGRWLRRGNVLEVIYGDSRIDVSEWVPLFLGTLTGSAGVVRTRSPGGGGPVSRITFRAVTREADYLRYASTSEDFSVGTSHQEIVETIAETDMGLDPDELALASFSALVTGHVSTQFVDEPPLVSIAKAMFPSGLMPRFRSDGMLAQSFGSITRGADRLYDDESLFFVVETPFSDLNPYNRVVVKGLSAELSRVSQPRQPLAEIQITTGFFTQSEEVEAFWSEDRTIYADNVALEILKSVNGGLVPLGGSESFSLISPSVPSPEGAIGAVLELDTGFAPELLIFLTATYLSLAALPDSVVTDPISGTGFTISLGRVEQAAQLSLMLFLMLRVGRGVYRFVGEPFEYVFLELQGIAEVEGVRLEDRNELVIENHLVQSQANANAAARDVLFREQAKGNPRTIRMLFDPGLEPDDVLAVLSTGRRFLIDRVSYTLQRGVEVTAEVSAFEVTEGSFL